MNKLFITGLIAVLAVAQAEAQTKKSNKTTSTVAQTEQGGQTGVKIEDVKPADAVPKTGEIDADEVITNRKLRAETGSKNKYSFSAYLNYSGGSIKDPGSEVRPNITGSLGTQTDVKLSGTLGGKYKISSLQSISADVGVGIDKPFHSDDKSFSERSYADNPSMTYQVLAKLGGVQSVTQLGATWYTSDFLRRLGYAGGVSLSQIMVYDFGGSKFSLGANIALGANWFDKSSPALDAQQGDYSAGLYPFMEYVISDKLNVRTISGVWVYDHDRAHEDDMSTWSKNKIYQSVGLGISVTRDFYLYPNVQFMPENIKDERTNVAISANINL
ncbi:MAG: hypothetical protein AB7N80_10845 [Bdellovibrionales bacterium]